ncbi:MAG: hemolysin III family protein [Puniceicoccales bacterium]|jgi:hemolysin III|nr:hemolysin III family protein [Puniceicoccales bacterium]
MKQAATQTGAASGTAYSIGEEIANSISHGIGAILSVAGLAVLVTFTAIHGDAWAVVSTAVYGSTLILLYMASTLYHFLRGEQAKRVLRKFDHAAIFLLIAGTYTPFVLGPLRLHGALGWGLFGTVWGLAIAGVVLKFWFTGRFRALSTGIYVGMGWLILVAAKPLFEAMSWPAISLLIAGGACYTGGVVFYTMRRLPYHHAIWHAFVLGGSVCQYFAVLKTMVPG